MIFPRHNILANSIYIYIYTRSRFANLICPFYTYPVSSFFGGALTKFPSTLRSVPAIAPQHPTVAGLIQRWCQWESRWTNAGELIRKQGILRFLFLCLFYFDLTISTAIGIFWWRFTRVMEWVQYTSWNEIIVLLIKTYHVQLLFFLLVYKSLSDRSLEDDAAIMEYHGIIW